MHLYQLLFSLLIRQIPDKKQFYSDSHFGVIIPQCQGSDSDRIMRQLAHCICSPKTKTGEFWGQLTFSFFFMPMLWRKPAVLPSLRQVLHNEEGIFAKAFGELGKNIPLSFIPFQRWWASDQESYVPPKSFHFIVDSPASITLLIHPWKVLESHRSSWQQVSLHADSFKTK